MSDTKSDKPLGTKIKVVATPVLSTWPAFNAKKHFGIEITDCRKLKQGEAVDIPKAVAEKLTQAKLVQAYPQSEGGK